jgi:Na+-driven multidrug efflux pump
LIFATWITLGGLTMLFARPLLAIYTPEPEVIGLGVQRIHVMMIAYFTCGMMNVYPGLTRGMGYSVLPMVCTLLGACLLRIVWLATFFAWYPTEVMLFVCYPITWALAGIGQVGSFFYARRRVRRQAFSKVRSAAS